MPSFTFCPWTAFKELGFHYTTEKYENVTFGLGDLLNVSILNLPDRDIKYINATETRSPSLGKCFTLKITRPVGLNDPFVLVLKRSFDLKVFVHNDGEEFWLSSSPYGTNINMFRLNIKSDFESVMTVLNVAERQVQYYPKSVRPCNATNSGNDRGAILKDAENHRFLPKHFLLKNYFSILINQIWKIPFLKNCGKLLISFRKLPDFHSFSS